MGRVCPSIFFDNPFLLELPLKSFCIVWLEGEGGVFFT